VTRRDFITLLGGAAAAWPLAARAQQTGKIARIGILGSSLTPENAAHNKGFLDELRQLGFSEDRNLTVHIRGAGQDRREDFAIAAEMIRSKVDLLAVSGPEVALQAAIGASRTIPIVMLANNFDPIVRGYVTNLARPGGNITGVFYRQPELAAKQLELLTQAFPERTRVGVLWDSFSADQFGAVEHAAKSLHLELRSLKVENLPYDFDAMFRTLAQGTSQMLHVLFNPLISEHRPRVAELAIQYRLPAIFTEKSYVEEGGLMSYGVDVVKTYRMAATYVAKILKGAKPADLPVEQPSKFELVINLKTAKALGISVPPTLLARADEVIE